ncbi:MAG: c-type cytochrome [Gammaproteobacteria bacterium]
MKKTIVISLSFFLSALVFAAHEPRLESEEAQPEYSIECTENARSASACKVDQLTYDGWKTFKIECQQCHGGGAMGSTFAPNLMERMNKEGVDYGRFLYVMDNGYTGKMGVMPSLEKVPRVQKNKAALFSYLKARADGVLPNGRPPKPDDQTSPSAEIPKPHYKSCCDK